jgi:hypothetical protein
MIVFYLLALVELVAVSPFGFPARRLKLIVFSEAEQEECGCCMMQRWQQDYEWRCLEPLQMINQL